MVHFTRAVHDGALTKVRDLMKYIVSMPVCHTHMYSTNTEIVDYFISLLLIIK